MWRMYLILYCVIFRTLTTGTVINIIHTNNTGNIDYSKPNPLSYYTPLSLYGIDVSRRTYIRFLLKAKESAFVSLWSSANISNAMFYEIALGAGHTAIALRRNKNSIFFDHFVNDKWMSDTQFMPFWISWEKGVIEIGTSSELHNDTRKSWSDPNPLNISYAGIMTGWGQDGDWIIYPYTVEEAKCCSCSGREHTQNNISSKDASTKAKRLKKELMVNKESLSKFERRKICADDFRDSSKHMGYIGAIVLTLIVIFVCGLDCL